MTAFDGSSAKVGVFFDGVYPGPSFIGISLSDEIEPGDVDILTPEEAIEVATDLISAANIRFAEQGKLMWMLPVQFRDGGEF